MRTDAIARVGRIAGILLTMGVLFALFLLVVRPWHVDWGSSRAEATAELAGDELLRAESQTTRAITITAPASEIWPWLLQLGQDRGGFYSYEFLENLVGTNMNNVDTLRPELQHWKLGDKLWMYPPEKLGGAGHGVLQRLDPGRALVFGTRQFGTGLNEPTNGTWAFLLQPMDAETTRLVVRGRAAGKRTLVRQAFDMLVFEPVHFVMERKMMEGIKARAERSAPSELSDLLEVSMFAACFGLFAFAVLRAVRWPVARRSLLVIAAGGLIFQLLTFVQPPWIVGVLLVFLLVALYEFAQQA